MGRANFAFIINSYLKRSLHQDAVCIVRHNVIKKICISMS